MGSNPLRFLLVDGVFVAQRANRRHYDPRYGRPSYARRWYDAPLFLTLLMGLAGFSLFFVLSPVVGLNPDLLCPGALLVIAVPFGWGFLTAERLFRNGRPIDGELLNARIYTQSSRSKRVRLMVRYSFVTPEGNQKEGHETIAFNGDFFDLPDPPDEPNSSGVKTRMMKLLFGFERKRGYIQAELDRLAREQKVKVKVQYVNDHLFRVL